MQLLFTSTLSQAAKKICTQLEQAGYTAWFAGGCVRDSLLKQTPKDIDIATNATPKQILQLFPHGEKVGASFGVILLPYQGFCFDIATFRQENDYQDGRHPNKVEFTQDAKLDAQRRDFTINALYWDPSSEKLQDFVGGVDDFHSSLLRCVGNPATRFQEDSLRLLRAIRFASRLNFEIEATTWTAICNHAQQISRISPERIFAELEQMWLHPSRNKAFDLLHKSGLLEALFPEIIAMKGVEQPPQYHPEGDVFTHTSLVLSHLPETAPTNLVWAALFHDIGKPETANWDNEKQRWCFNSHAKVGATIAKKILTRLRAPNKTKESVSTMVYHHMDFIHVQQMRKSTLRRMMARPTFVEELQLHKADCMGSNGLLDNWEFLCKQRQLFAKETPLPPPLLNGKEIIRITAIPPGPQLGKLIQELHDLQLEGILKNKQQALHWLQKNYSNTQEE